MTTEPTDAEILNLWESFVGEPTEEIPLSNSDKLCFARAALRSWGQPSGASEVVVTKTEAGQIVAVTRQDEEGRILSVIAESTPQPTQAQAGAVPPIECNTEELKRAYAFGWWSALEKQREALHAGAVPLNHKNIEPVRRFLADRGIYLSDETTKALITVAHGIKGGQHGESV